MLSVVLPVLGEDEDVIQIDKNKVVKHLLEGIVNECLEGH